MFSGAKKNLKFFLKNILATTLKSYIITLLQKQISPKKMKKVEKIGIITTKCSELTTSLVTFGF